MGRLSRGTGILLSTAERTVGAGSHEFVTTPSAYLIDFSLAGFSHSDIFGKADK